MQACASPSTLAACVMRAHPVHHGHLSLLEHALSHAPRVVVALADAHQARTPATPFTLDERIAMLQDSLTPEARERVHILPLRNLPQRAQRERAIEQGVQALLRQWGWPVDTAVTWLDCARHAADPQVLRPGGWPCQVHPPDPGLPGPELLNLWFGAGPVVPEATWSQLAQAVPAASLSAMRRLCETPAFGELVEEWRMLARYREAWATAPYPPVFVTVDVVLQCAGHVLLIERGQAPGKGLLALPGGFIDPRDSTWQSAVRELREETQLQLGDAELTRACRAQAVFDHPDRSQRGRTITHAFHIDLGEAPMPRVKADDDARDARWVPTAELLGMASRLHDDHFFILDHFLGLLSEGG